MMRGKITTRIPAFAAALAAGALAAYTLRGASPSTLPEAQLQRPAAEVRTQVIRRTIHVVRHEKPPRSGQRLEFRIRSGARRGERPRRHLRGPAHRHKRRPSDRLAELATPHPHEPRRQRAGRRSARELLARSHSHQRLHRLGKRDDRRLEQPTPDPHQWRSRHRLIAVGRGANAHQRRWRAG